MRNFVNSIFVCYYPVVAIIGIEVNLMSALFFKLCKEFSDDDRINCLLMANRIIELAYVSRKEGILALLEETILGCEFAEFGLDLLLNGGTPEIIQKSLTYAIIAGNYTGSDLLNKIIITEGLVLISTPYTPPQVIARVINSILGVQYKLELKKDGQLQLSS